MLRRCKICSGTDMYAQRIDVGSGGIDILPLGAFTKKQLDVYVCGDCGHLEWFVPRKTLEKVKKKFTPVPDTSTKVFEKLTR